MTTSHELLEQLVQLTDAVKQLAERPDASQPSPFESWTEADRIRQRVAFAWSGLGLLTGRVSSPSGNEFDIPVVRATRIRNVVAFAGLPHGADWVELRDGNKVEVLRIQGEEDRSPIDPIDQSTTSNDGARNEPSDKGLVKPRDFKETDPISSLVFLTTRRGPLIAFGPRLAPFRSDATDLHRV